MGRRRERRRVSQGCVGGAKSDFDNFGIFRRALDEHVYICMNEHRMKEAVCVTAIFAKQANRQYASVLARGLGANERM